MGIDFSSFNTLLGSIRRRKGDPVTEIKCPYCDATKPRPRSTTCGCGATVFDVPDDPTHEGKDYRGARMQGAILQGQDLRNADFTEARLQGAILSGSDLRGAKFTNARMQGAILSGARTDGADFTGARMQGVVR
jgi:hypothetical protein